MVRVDLTECVETLIDELSRLHPLVLRTSDKDRIYPALIRKKVLGSVDVFIDAEKRALDDYKYDRNYGTSVMHAILPLTHSLSCLEAMASYGGDFALMQAYCDTKWSIGNCIKELEKLVPEKPKGY